MNRNKKLANMAMLVALAMIFSYVTGFLFGNGMSIIYSLAGAVVSLLAMVLVKKMDGISIVGVSITGGVFHNIGQILVAMAVVENLKLIYYLPVLLVAGTVTGFVIGIVAGKILPVVKKEAVRTV